MIPYKTDCRVVLHASTPKARGSLHFHVYETPDEYVSTIRELILAVNQVPNTFLIVKFRSGQLGVEELRTLLPSSDRYTISVEEPFLDVLGIADLLVSFSSTTIEEALQNRVPVLLYGGGGRYQHVEAMEVGPETEAKPGAVYHVRQFGHLPAALEQILEVNGKAPLPSELFQQYIYKPEEVDSFPELVSNLVGS